MLTFLIILISLVSLIVSTIIGCAIMKTRFNYYSDEPSWFWGGVFWPVVLLYYYVKNRMK